jgi:hypothetical protein
VRLRPPSGGRGHAKHQRGGRLPNDKANDLGGDEEGQESSGRTLRVTSGGVRTDSQLDQHSGVDTLGSSSVAFTRPEVELGIVREDVSHQHLEVRSDLSLSVESACGIGASTDVFSLFGGSATQTRSHAEFDRRTSGASQNESTGRRRFARGSSAVETTRE